MEKERDFLVEKIGNCVVITMDHGENKMNSNYIRIMNKALDAAEEYEDATCLVTMGTGKYYSMGVDEEWRTWPDDEFHEFMHELQKLFCRILVFPLVTVAALNGHAYSGGLFMGICHDYIIMRTKRGWLCIPEVRLKLKFSSNFFSFIRARIPPLELHRAIVFSKRYTCEEALAAKIVDEACPVEELKEKAIAAGNRLAGEEGLDREILASIKRDLYRDACKALMEPNYHSSL